LNIYDIAIPPNTGRQIDVQADYIYFRTGTAGGGDTTVVFQPLAGGESVYLQPGQAYKMPAAMRGKNVSWVLRNLKGEGTIIGVLLMGEGEFQDNRVSGSVEVIDGGKARSLAGIACIGMVTSNAQAGNISHVQLWNPADSTKNLIIEQVLSVSGVTPGIWHAVTNGEIGPVAAAITAKRIGTGYSGKAQLRQVKSVSQLGQLITLINSPVGVTGSFKPNEPIVLPPGFGYLLFPQAAAADITATFEWYEDPL